VDTNLHAVIVCDATNRQKVKEFSSNNSQTRPQPTTHKPQIMAARASGVSSCGVANP